jgi:hypothetical protein
MPGPGGTLDVELIGAGVSWQLRPTAEGVVVVHHAGDLPGYHPHLMLVPAKQFAIVFLNNGELGSLLKSELFTRDWVLRHFVRLHNLPAPPRRLSASELAQYEGHYVVEDITFENQVAVTEFQLTARPDGTLLRTYLGSGDAEAEDDLGPGAATLPAPAILTFYADDYVIDESTGARYNFLRDGSGTVVWLRYSARLRRRGG